MINLDDLRIFDNKRERRVKSANGLYFSILKSTKVTRCHIELDFTFNELMCKEYSIAAGNKIRLGCAKSNNRIWYLLFRGNKGYTIRDRKAVRANILGTKIGSPFDDLQAKKMCFVDAEKIIYYKEESIIQFSVEHIFNKDELIIKK